MDACLEQTEKPPLNITYEFVTLEDVIQMCKVYGWQWEWQPEAPLPNGQVMHRFYLFIEKENIIVAAGSGFDLEQTIAGCVNRLVERVS